MKNPRRRAACAAAIAITTSVTALGISPAEASVYSGSVEFTCTGAVAAGTGDHLLDRDNTGSGQESLLVEIFDGAGNELVNFPYTNTLGNYAGGIGSFTYDTAPVANPITFRLTSLAGNELPAQVDVLVQGTCDELPATQVTRPPGGIDPVGTTPTSEQPTTTDAPTTTEPPTTTAPPTTVPGTTVTSPRPTTTMTPPPTTVRPGQAQPAAAARPLAAAPAYAG